MVLSFFTDTATTEIYTSCQFLSCCARHIRGMAISMSIVAIIFKRKPFVFMVQAKV